MKRIIIISVILILFFVSCSRIIQTANYETLKNKDIEQFNKINKLEYVIDSLNYEIKIYKNTQDNAEIDAALKDLNALDAAYKQLN
jgi:PBP1b-binding outer membrane lipoprotein LpoB